jgi:tol-pal system protein YbgF
MQKTNRIFTLILFLSSLTACLTTRSQMGGEDAENSDVVGRAEPTPVNNSTYAEEELKAEVTRLNGRIEEIERSNTNTGKDVKSSEEYQAMQKRIEDLEKAQLEALEQLKKMQANIPQPERKDLFEQGKTAFNAKNYDAAIQAFSQYLGNPSAKLAEEATYLRGEAQYRMKSFKNAILDFANFPEKYAKSSLYPKALARIADSYESLGMKEEARAFLSELSEKFPRSTEGKEAKARLLKK